MDVCWVVLCVIFKEDIIVEFFGEECYEERFGKVRLVSFYLD